MEENFLKKRTKSSWTNPFRQRQWKSHYTIEKWSGSLAQKYDCSSGWIGWRVHWMNMRSGVRICSLAMLLFLWNNWFGQPVQSAEPGGSTGLWPVHWCGSSIPAIGPDNGPVLGWTGWIGRSGPVLVTMIIAINWLNKFPSITSKWSPQKYNPIFKLHNLISTTKQKKRKKIKRKGKS